MPLHPDFKRIRQSMRSKYGKEKGDEVFWSWLNKKGLDETKPMSKQKAEAQDILDIFPIDYTEDDSLDEDMIEAPEEGTAEAKMPQGDPSPALLGEGQMPPQQPQDPVPTTKPDPTEALKPEGLGEADTDKPITVGVNAPPPPNTGVDEVPLHDGMNRRDQQAEVTASSKGNYVSIPAYHFNYVAAPKFEGKDAPVIIKAIVLEEGHNVNNWRVMPEEFAKVADQYKAGRHLRVNHEKTVESVIGMSFDGKVIKGLDIKQYLGKDIEGIDPEGLYVTAEFEANPQDPQIRTNILNGYVVTGSIGLDAEAFCEECNKPLTTDDKGEMQKTCRHYESPVYLKNVEVKEYSYVAEPAYEHTQAFPTFSAALDSVRGSSIINSQPKEEQMSATVQPKAEVQAAKATAKKAEGEGEGEGDADAKLATYKQGYADALKHLKAFFPKSEATAKADDEPDEDDVKVKAESEGEGDADASVKAESEGEGEGDASAKAAVKAKRKTDQITKQGPSSKRIVPPNLFEMAWHPSQYRNTNAVFNELFEGAAHSQGAPVGFREKAKLYKEGRYEA